MGVDSAVRLRVRGRSAAYGRIVVVRGADLDVRAGSVHALLGPNGAGKTSLAESLAGRVRGEGEVSLDGVRLDRMAAHQRARHGFGLVPTNRALFPPMTVQDNLELGGRLVRRARREELRERVLSLFPMLGERLAQPAGMLSGGEQQMLAIAKVLLGDPKVLILDEPVQGLAPVARQILATAIREVARDGLAVLLIEQNLAFAAAVADEFTVLSGGAVTRRGDAAGLRDREELFAAYLEEGAGP